MIITHTRAGPSAWTFRIKPIKELVYRYVGNGEGWVDPFAGDNSPAEFTNDQHPERNAIAHIDAKVFCELVIPDTPGFNGILFDPPYSYRQVTEHYKSVGMKARSIDTSNNFYNRVMNAIADKIRPGGYAISCGWNSNGFGKNRGFEPVEILVVAHGQHHNDTIVLVEQRAGRQEYYAGEEWVLLHSSD